MPASSSDAETSSQSRPTSAPTPAPADPVEEEIAETAQTPPPAPAIAPSTDPKQDPPKPDKTEQNKTPETVAAKQVRTQMIATIYYPNGGISLTTRDLNILQQVADIYVQKQARRIIIIGHSSRKGATGSQAEQSLVNYKVSLDRAASIGQILLENGVPIEHIAIDARSASELKFSEETSNGEAGNRRAEILCAAFVSWICRAFWQGPGQPRFWQIWVLKLSR
jgi:type VI secretion system protein ImpK